MAILPLKNTRLRRLRSTGVVFGSKSGPKSPKEPPKCPNLDSNLGHLGGSEGTPIPNDATNDSSTPQIDGQSGEIGSSKQLIEAPNTHRRVSVAFSNPGKRYTPVTENRTGVSEASCANTHAHSPHPIYGPSMTQSTSNFVCGTLSAPPSPIPNNNPTTPPPLPLDAEHPPKMSQLPPKMSQNGVNEPNLGHTVHQIYPSDPQISLNGPNGVRSGSGRQYFSGPGSRSRHRRCVSDVVGSGVSLELNKETYQNSNKRQHNESKHRRVHSCSDKDFDVDEVLNTFNDKLAKQSTSFNDRLFGSRQVSFSYNLEQLCEACRCDIECCGCPNVDKVDCSNGNGSQLARETQYKERYAEILRQRQTQTQSHIQTQKPSSPTQRGVNASDSHMTSDHHKPHHSRLQNVSVNQVTTMTYANNEYNQQITVTKAHDDVHTAPTATRQLDQNHLMITNHNRQPTQYVDSRRTSEDPMAPPSPIYTISEIQRGGKMSQNRSKCPKKGRFGWGCCYNGGSESDSGVTDEVTDLVTLSEMSQNGVVSGGTDVDNVPKDDPSEMSQLGDGDVDETRIWDNQDVHGVCCSCREAPALALGQAVSQSQPVGGHSPQPDRGSERVVDSSIPVHPPSTVPPSTQNVPNDADVPATPQRHVAPQSHSPQASVAVSYPAPAPLPLAPAHSLACTVCSGNKSGIEMSTSHIFKDNSIATGGYYNNSIPYTSTTNINSNSNPVVRTHYRSSSASDLRPTVFKYHVANGNVNGNGSYKTIDSGSYGAPIIRSHAPTNTASSSVLSHRRAHSSHVIGSSGPYETSYRRVSGTNHPQHSPDLPLIDRTVVLEDAEGSLPVGKLSGANAPLVASSRPTTNSVVRTYYPGHGSGTYTLGGELIASSSPTGDSGVAPTRTISGRPAIISPSGNIVSGTRVYQSDIVVPTSRVTYTAPPTRTYCGTSEVRQTPHTYQYPVIRPSPQMSQTTTQNYHISGSCCDCRVQQPLSATTTITQNPTFSTPAPAPAVVQYYPHLNSQMSQNGRPWISGRARGTSDIPVRPMAPSPLAHLAGQRSIVRHPYVAQSYNPSPERSSGMVGRDLRDLRDTQFGETPFVRSQTRTVLLPPPSIAETDTCLPPTTRRPSVVLGTPVRGK